MRTTMHRVRPVMRSTTVPANAAPPDADRLEWVHSNRARLALVQGTGRGGAMAVDLAQPPEPADPAPLRLVEMIAADPSRLGTERTLPGHGAGSEKDGDAASIFPAPMTAPPGQDTAAPAATVALVVHSPTETRRPEAAIAGDHGHSGVAGWTTPSYAVTVPSLSADTATVRVVLDFDIELAEEFTDARLAVLRDHEHGHVGIGTAAVQAHLVDGLEATLESLPGFTSAGAMQAAIVGAAGAFVATEAGESQVYDDADYPRMLEAYLGAATPLTDLADASDPVADITDTLDAYARHAPNITRAGQLRSLVKDVDKAWEDLDSIDLYRIQYNPAFALLVAHCHDVTTELLDRLDTETPGLPTPGDDTKARALLKDTRRRLNAFEWQPDL